MSLKVCFNSGFHLKARIHIETASTQNINIEKKPNTYMYAYVEKRTYGVSLLIVSYVMMLLNDRCNGMCISMHILSLILFLPRKSVIHDRLLW